MKFFYFNEAYITMQTSNFIKYSIHDTNFLYYSHPCIPFVFRELGARVQLSLNLAHVGN